MGVVDTESGPAFTTTDPVIAQAVGEGVPAAPAHTAMPARLGVAIIAVGVRRTQEQGTGSKEVVLLHFLAAGPLFRVRLLSLARPWVGWGGWATASAGLFCEALAARGCCSLVWLITLSHSHLLLPLLAWLGSGWGWVPWQHIALPAKPAEATRAARPTPLGHIVFVAVNAYTINM